MFFKTVNWQTTTGGILKIEAQPDERLCCDLILSSADCP